jgi:hypothetical protein
MSQRGGIPNTDTLGLGTAQTRVDGEFSSPNNNVIEQVVTQDRVLFNSRYTEDAFPPTREYSSTELQESAWQVYQDTSQGGVLQDSCPYYYAIFSSI